jgi:uncharacterized protein (DUF302 family)
VKENALVYAASSQRQETRAVMETPFEAKVAAGARDPLRLRSGQAFDCGCASLSRSTTFAQDDNAIKEKVMQGNGVLQIASPYSVEETVKRLESILGERSVRVFALVDHSGEAEKVGMKMRPTKLVIFGNPKGGTPVMVAAPSVAIDLPLKALVWEDENGKVWVSYNSPEYLQQRHGVPEDLIKNIAVVGALVAKAVE